jgi:hypothetical protein
LDRDFAEPEEEQSQAFWNVHHAIKAHAMKHGLPTQIVWERTLRGKNVKQDPATMAWNLFTAIYQKANNVPWQLETLPEATCFVGISFFRSDPSKPMLKTSLAQAFSGRGKGLVLQGPRTITDRKGNPVPHLSEKEAEVLLTNVLKLIFRLPRYKAETGSRSQNVQILARRTWWFPKSLLYTTGYIPALSAYPRMRVPMPIEIIEHHGHSPIDVVCQENTCPDQNQLEQLQLLVP